MKKSVIVLLICLVPVLVYGSMSDETNWDLSPSCVHPGEIEHIKWTVHYYSNDAEDIIVAQFVIGYDWTFGDIETPPPGSISGHWSTQVFPSASTVEWTFERSGGQDGGGVEDGESVTFSFWTEVGYEDNNVMMALFGDVATDTPPHQLDWNYQYPFCNPDDDDVTDDDVADDTDDDWHDDTLDDDSSDDDTSADDDTGDDNTNFDFDEDDADNNDSSDDDGSTGCGC